MKTYVCMFTTRTIQQNNSGFAGCNMYTLHVYDVAPLVAVSCVRFESSVYYQSHLPVANDRDDKFACTWRAV